MLPYVIFVAVVMLVLFRHRNRIKKNYGSVARVSAPLKTYLLPTPQEYKDILRKYFRYYQKLSPKAKSKFELKLMNFIYGKKFIPRNIESVSVEAKVLIAASAVQLTFGLSHVYLRHFDKILVYPNDYYSRITHHYHKGEVNPRFGIIVLSWQAFVDGYIGESDSKNVGLHEMAHALRLENRLRSKNQKFFDEALLDAFDTWADKICREGDKQSFFRPYACVNKDEFFSVAVENFFERPEAFSEELPELYTILSALLRQDPLKL